MQRSYQSQPTCFLLTATLLLTACGNSDSAGHDNGVGGALGTGGGASTGGQAASGGVSATGGAPTTGGDVSTGGAPATGGAATGGDIATGGAPATGGALATGGATLTGGNAPTGGTAATGGSSTTGGAPTASSLRFDLPVDLLPNNAAYKLTEDITGDGRRDAAWFDPFSQSGRTLLTFAVAQPDGSYTPVPPISLPGSGQDLVYADFNADKIKDLILPDTSSGSPIFRMYLGNGDGTFTPGGEYPRGIPGDFNNDGRTDSLAVGPSSWPSSYAYLAQSDGTFTKLDVPFISNASYVGTGDFDGDGKLDVYLGLSVRRGLGDGTFGGLLSPTCASCSDPPDYPLVTDLNADGRSDLVVPYYWQVFVLLGQPDGSLKESAMIDFPSPQGIVAGQLDGDGKLDLVVGNDSGQLDLLYGDGAGNIEERRSYFNSRAYNTGPSFIEDRNADGLADIVIDRHYAAYGRGQRRIRLPEFTNYTPTGNGSPYFVDLGHDGVGDLAFAYIDAKIYQAAFGRDRYLGPGEVCNGPGSNIYRRVLDMTGDGLPDVVSFSGDLSVWVGQGGCTYATAVPHAFNIGWAWLQKIDDDELVDVIYITAGGLGITLATAPGLFAPPIVSPFTGYATALAAADFNGDGYLDAVAFDEDKLLFTVLFGNVNYNLTAAYTMNLASGEMTYQLTAADIDNDGDTDVVMGIEAATSSIDVLRNDGQGQFTREKLTSADTLAGFSVADIDRDGKLELIADLSQQTMGIFRVGPTGPATLLMNLLMPRNSVPFDVDGDGDLDLVQAYSNYVAVANNLMFE